MLLLKSPKSPKLLGWPSRHFVAGSSGVELVERGVRVVVKVAGRARVNHRLPCLETTTGDDWHGLKPKAKSHQARAVGVGLDADTERARVAARVAERSPWAVEETSKHHELGRAIMLLAGGRNFVAGQQVRLTDRGMAGKAARYVESGGRGRNGMLFASRGRMPSDTSLDEAAAVAAAAVVEVLPVVSFALHGCLGVNLVDITGADIWERGDVRGYLSGVAWKAAFASYTDDFTAESGATVGRKDKAEFMPGAGVPIALDAGQIATARASLTAHFAGKPMEDHELVTRRAVCSWLWRSLVPSTVARGANEQRARAGAVKRARFLIRLVHRQPWSDAARLSGYQDGAAAAKALADGKTFLVLSAAAAADGKRHPTAAALRAMAARAWRVERAARRSARPVLRTTAARGARGGRPVRVVDGPCQMAAGGGWVWRRGAVALAGSGVMYGAWRLVQVGLTGGRASRRVAGLRVDLWATAGLALDAVEQAARARAGAIHAAAGFAARASSSFDSASRGLRRGHLQG